MGLIEKTIACAGTYESLRQDLLFVPFFLPFGVLYGVFTFCQSGPREFSEVVEKNTASGVSLPGGLVKEVAGRLRITEPETMTVFVERSAHYKVTDGKFSIDLPVLNNRGEVRVEFDGGATVGNKQLPLKIDRHVTL